ncbi:MAG: lipoprotein [Pirellulaceae bacterium]|nr:MAG: lipoprotein [Pirellulaceae bacterium]
MSFLNTLVWWQWLVVVGVPIAIILLYFLKLRRLPVEVPSTYLWSRTLEDLHVNSLWQRLRQSLLLFLQILFACLLIVALLRPGWKGSRLEGERFIIVLDTSASMQATDIRPSRLEDAKRQAIEFVDSLSPGQTAMLITTSDQSRVEQPYTDNRALLRSRIRAVEATYRTSDLEEALRYASGLANPGRSATDPTDVPAPEPMPATMLIFSDGGYERVPSIFLGNLTPKYIPMGQPQPDNVAIVAFAAERGIDDPLQIELYGRLENFSDVDVQANAVLYVNGKLQDAKRLQIEAGGVRGVEFSLRQVEAGYVELRWERDDDLLLDNRAFAAINPPRRARVLLVTAGNEPLELALTTSQAQLVAELRIEDPQFLKSDQYRRAAAASQWDLIIYDRCAPDEAPAANTVWFGSLPPDPRWKANPLDRPPQIIDLDRAHPVMQLVEVTDLLIVEGHGLEIPPGGRALLDGDSGPLCVIAPREAYEDLVIGFSLFRTEDNRTVPNTNWPIRRSFPIFCMNMLRYLGTGSSAMALPSVRPGQPITLHSAVPVDALYVTAPDGRVWTVGREATGRFVFAQTELPGIYEVRESKGGPVVQRFPVNLFDRRESNIRPEPQLQFAHTTVAAEPTRTPVRRELWRWIVAVALGVLAFEWYIYNRRVYL